jgi:CHAT domain-containing protein/Tfp pilus assembly protein PilF
MFPFMSRVSASSLAVAACLASLWLGLCGGAALAQPLPPGQELAPEDRRKLEQEALQLNDQGVRHWQQGRLDEALRLMTKALQAYRRLYPPERFPSGHAALAGSLNNVGAMLQTRGELAQAEPYYREAVAMNQKLYPPGRFPDGHPRLAGALLNLAGLLAARGELAQAERFYRQALAMYQKTDPAGHRNLALALNNLGTFLRNRGDLAEAEPYLRQALAMYEKLYPAAKFPEGHAEVALALNNLGALLKDQGELAQAERYYRRALVMYQKLYVAERYPDGHPYLAQSLHNVGRLLQEQGALARAEPLLREALAMRQRLYPPERFADGHPDLVETLSSLGSLMQDRDEPAQAESYLRKALATQQRLLNPLLASSAEVEALNFLAQLPFTRDAYLSVAGRLPDKAADAYAVLWHSKGAVIHMLQQRRRTLLLAHDPTSRALADKLTATRQALANLLRPGAGPGADRVRALSAQKEELEKQLASRLPLYQTLQERLTHGPADLVRLLPQGSVFIDLTRYRHIERAPGVPGDKGERWTLSYVAFVLARGRAIARVKLGEAEPIDRALATWRRALQAGQDASSTADTLRRLLWAPLEKHCPARTRTVLVAPDAALTGLPWAALPGRRAGTVLLEDYALSTVPDGQMLLGLLRLAAGTVGPDRLLVAGGIDYNGPGERVPPGNGQGKGRVLWPALPGTARELELVRRWAGQRPFVERRGTAATTGQLLADLPQARWAHLATHGFFADPKVRSILQLSAQDYQRGRRGERIGPGMRSPLVLSGLVCAGANRPVHDPEKEDGGILTAEAIAGLSLDGLELAVLSACETGLGEAGGEGIFGLQRAFHLAGAKNVIASLWKVDDEATAALMGLFYHKLWQEQLPAAEALRQAQLALYHHPERIALLARARGPDFEKAARLPAASGAASARRSPARLWAGFVLSGVGR